MSKVREVRKKYFRKKALGGGSTFCWEEVWSETSRFSSDKAVQKRAEELQRLVDNKKLRADGWLIDRVKFELITTKTTYDSILAE